MVNETIQYYTENGGNPVYLLLLGATKAFDEVLYKVLFDVLLDKKVCHRIVNLLYYMYSNQQCHVKWGDAASDSFGISNGVKQGGVISPLLFSLYIDELFLLLKESGMGCHQGWGQVQLTKYTSTPSTPKIYQVQVLVKYSFFKKVLKYIKYFHIKYKYKYKYSY